MISGNRDQRPKDRWFKAGHRRNAGGYTLLEMLIVLGIFSLVMGFALPALNAGSPALLVKSASAELAGAFRTARAEAIAGNKSVGVSLDLSANQYIVGGQSARSLGDQSLRIEITTARALLAGEDAGTIVFFPDGTSSGGRIILESGRARGVIEIDWMTGWVRIADEGPGA